MNLHSKARTCPASRGLIAKRMLKGAWSEDQAATLGISARTAFKWLSRYRAEGEAGLVEQLAAPPQSPADLSRATSPDCASAAIPAYGPPDCPTTPDAPLHRCQGTEAGRAAAASRPRPSRARRALRA